MSSYIPQLEALLFVHGEPLSFARMEKLLGVSRKDTEEVVAQYEEILKARGGGLALLKDHEKVQLVSRPELSALVGELVKEELTDTPTPAALETLSVIAYLGPVTKSRIEYLRGVNSAFTLRNLVLRGLVSRSPNPKEARTFLYDLSFDSLKHLGMLKREDLPDYEKFRGMLQGAEAVVSES